MLPNTSICRLVTLSLLAFAPSAFATNAKVLIYSATEDFRHDSIPTAIQALQSKGPSFDIQFETTEDKAQFTDQYLARYDALLFLDNTGEGEFHDLRQNDVMQLDYSYLQYRRRAQIFAEIRRIL